MRRPILTALCLASLAPALLSCTIPARSASRAVSARPAPPAAETTVSPTLRMYKGLVGADGLSLDVRASRSAEGSVALGVSLSAPGEMQLVLEPPGLVVDAELSPHGALRRVYAANPQDANGDGPGLDRVSGTGGGAAVFRIPKETRALSIHPHARLVSQAKDPDLMLLVQLSDIPVVPSAVLRELTVMGTSPSF